MVTAEHARGIAVRIDNAGYAARKPIIRRRDEMPGERDSVGSEKYVLDDGVPLSECVSPHIYLAGELSSNIIKTCVV